VIEFNKAVQSIVNNVALREKVIQQAQEWIYNYHSPQQETLEYINLYK
jgi:hypothetical protein